MRIASLVVKANGSGQDRAQIFPWQYGKLLVVADGAGGIAGGAKAAAAVCATVGHVTHDQTSVDAVALLQQLDAQLMGIGESTAVVAVAIDNQVAGASVGDCGAWLIDAGRMLDLTASQRRKSLLGSGSALPVAFGPTRLSGRLLLASDGLLKYVPAERI